MAMCSTLDQVDVIEICAKEEEEEKEGNRKLITLTEPWFRSQYTHIILD